MPKVILSNYGKGRYAVLLDGEVKYKNTSQAKARIVAGEMSGSEDFIDETMNVSKDEKKEPKTKKSKPKDK